MSNIREKLGKYLDAFSRDRTAKFPTEEEWVELSASYNERTRLFRSLLENEQRAREHDEALNAAQAAERQANAGDAPENVSNANQIRQNAFFEEENAHENAGNGGQTPGSRQNASLSQARIEARLANQRHRLDNASFFRTRMENRTVA
ncbi:MAG: hypothetical protein GY738_22880 [Pseudoalteromonas sp.]|nr:hypothetical protein [Pseudoalteromonas sp.]